MSGLAFGERNGDVTCLRLWSDVLSVLICWSYALAIFWYDMLAILIWRTFSDVGNLLFWSYVPVVLIRRASGPDLTYVFTVLIWRTCCLDLNKSKNKTKTFAAPFCGVLIVVLIWRTCFLLWSDIQSWLFWSAELTHLPFWSDVLTVLTWRTCCFDLPCMLFWSDELAILTCVLAVSICRTCYSFVTSLLIWSDVLAVYICCACCSDLLFMLFWSDALVALIWCTWCADLTYLLFLFCCLDKGGVVVEWWRHCTRDREVAGLNPSLCSNNGTFLSLLRFRERWAQCLVPRIRRKNRGSERYRGRHVQENSSSQKKTNQTNNNNNKKHTLSDGQNVVWKIA